MTTTVVSDAGGTHTVMTAANPRIGSFVGIPQESDGRLDHHRLHTALRHELGVVRWQFDPAA